MESARYASGVLASASYSLLVTDLEILVFVRRLGSSLFSAQRDEKSVQQRDTTPSSTARTKTSSPNPDAMS